MSVGSTNTARSERGRERASLEGVDEEEEDDDSDSSGDSGTRTASLSSFSSAAPPCELAQVRGQRDRSWSDVGPTFASSQP